MKIGYARVSTLDQNLTLQIDALQKVGCEKIFQEKISGSKVQRPQLDKMLEHVRAGDTVVVWKLDRLGRSLQHLIELVGNLEKKDAGLISLNDPVDTTTAQGRLVFRIFASLAEFERELIRERTLAGVAAAKAKGVILGRPEGLSADAKKQARVVESLHKDGVSVAEVARQLKISRTTVYSYLKHRGIEY
ncbi:recombinase family protein [Larkinella insperata]|uniref:Recombinase family protein n=1 Tax=Larkinella insperata TaxID=332158 RepID=A0ABW3QBL1_9BACT|nr:recombinase family protein [Larkinella insperata]